MEKKKIKLLAIQMESEIGNKGANITKVRGLLEQNLIKKPADFVFLPEVWTCGWYCPCFRKTAESFSDGEALAMLKEIAKEFNVNIVGGSLIEKHENNIYTNSCPVINRDGVLVCTYEKNHLFSYYGDNEGDYVKSGSEPVLVELDGVRLGLTICYDIRFPEIYRAYRQAGADILVNMAAWGKKKKIPWDSMTTSRAVENQTYFVALTQTGKLKDGKENLGHSMILDYKGDILSEIEEKEGYVFAEADLYKMYEFRDKCTVLKDIHNSYSVKIV